MSVSFQGFLTKYCKELTSSSTTSLKRLFALADTEYPRAYEPLLLLAIAQNRVDYLLKQAQGSKINSSYLNFLSDWEKSTQTLEEYLATLPERDRYRRPYDAWKAESERSATDRAVLAQVSKALLEMLDTKKISRAQACKIANVNKGNFYAFLKGDPTKLSRNTAMDIYRQIEAL